MCNIQQTYTVWYLVKSHNRANPIVININSPDFAPVFTVYSGDCTTGVFGNCITHGTVPSGHSQWAFQPETTNPVYLSVGAEGDASGAFEMGLTQNENCC